MWESKFKQLQEFKKKYGHCNLRQGPASRELRSWANTQRKLKKAGTLDPTRQRRLESIGFPWIPLVRSVPSRGQAVSHRRTRSAAGLGITRSRTRNPQNEEPMPDTTASLNNTAASEPMTLGMQLDRLEAKMGDSSKRNKSILRRLNHLDDMLELPRIPSVVQRIKRLEEQLG